VRYDINLYPEREIRLRRRRRAARRGFLAGVPFSLALLLVGLVIAAGVRLDREARALEANLVGLRAAIPSSAPKGGIGVREIAARRVQRIDWAPLLGEMARSTPDEVALSEVRGQGRGLGDAERRLVLIGHLPEGTENLGPVLGLIDSLRVAPEMQVDFPDVALQTAETGAWVTFQITCGPKGSGK
jgi:hypothetical protein